MASYLPLILLATFVVILVIWWYYIYFLYSYRLRGVPHWGIQWPLIGSSIKLLRMSRHIERHHDPFLKYGSDIVFCMFAFAPAIITRDPDVVKTLVNSRKAVIPNMFQICKSILGRGLILSEGESWKMQRKLTAPAFHANVLTKNLLSFNQQSDKIMDLLKDEVHKETSDALAYTTEYAARTACDTSVGVPYDENKEKMEVYVADSVKFMDLFYKRISNILQYLDVVYQFNKNFRQEGYMISSREQFLNTLVNQRKALRNTSVNEQYSENNSDSPSLLDRLFHYRDTNNYYTDDLLLDEVQSFFQASLHTLPTTIACAIHFLAENPAVQERVFEEIEPILDGKSDKILTTNDLSQMIYLDAVLQETMRFCPAIPYLGKELSDVVETNGLKLPKGLIILALFTAVHRHPKYFDQPEEFVPERHLERKIGHPYAHVPFGGGPRVCIGFKYAMFSMKTFMAKLLMEYEIVSINHPVVLRPGVTMTSETGFKVQLRNRKCKAV